MGAKATFPASLHHGYAQLWSWDFNPDDGWVYVVSTGFQRDKGMILRRVLPDDIGDMTKYSGWGWADDQWAWDNEPTPITPPAETWGELTLRRLDTGTWILGGFLSSAYALGYRTIDSPTADLYDAQVQTPVLGTTLGCARPGQQSSRAAVWRICPPGSTAGRSRAASDWWCRSGTPRPAGRTGRCSSR